MKRTTTQSFVEQLALDMYSYICMIGGKDVHREFFVNFFFDDVLDYDNATLVQQRYLMDAYKGALAMLHQHGLVTAATFVSSHQIPAYV